MKIYSITAAFLATFSILGQSAFADQRDWRVTAICDSEAREARIEIVNCDGNASDETSCKPLPASVSDSNKSASIGISAGQSLITLMSDEAKNGLVRTNRPTEFSCEMPVSAQNPETVDYRQSQIFFRIERMPTNWNHQGQCGAAPWQVIVSIQTDTTMLDMDKPMQRIEMIGRCGWGDPHPLTRLSVDADTYEIETKPYDPKTDNIGWPIFD